MKRSRRLLSVPLTTLSVLFASVILFGGTVHAQSLTEVRPLSSNEQIIQQASQQVDQKSNVLQSTTQEVQTLEGKKKALADQLEAEKAKIADLKQQIADKKAAEAKVVVASAPEVIFGGGGSAAPTGQGPMSGCGDNQYAAYIYGQESGGHVTGNCNPSARNPGGCLGIGQACPGSKLVAACPNLDYACENAFFTNYANKYGGWAGSYQFWLANGWW